jgi:carboxypeptidase Taq
LEQAMIGGTVKIADLPELWNTRMQEYLGLTPPDDAQGVLQDVHWSAALMGYFPTYLLGSVLAVQFYEQAQADMPSLDESFAQGDFAPLLEWLREHVHQHGRKFTLPELTDRICGGPLSIEPYVNYLQTKFGSIYDL